MTIDTSGKKSFAVASVPVTYALREPPRLHKAIASEADKPPKPKDREAKPSRPISQATTGESETSYQRYIISHADYMQVDSPAITTASTTPATRGQGSGMKGQSLPSLQASSGASVSSKTRDSVQSSRSLSGESNVTGRFESASSSLQHSEDERESVMVGGSDGDSEVAMLTSHPQSTALTLEIDMRFSSEPLDHSSSDKILTASGSSSKKGSHTHLQSMSDMRDTLVDVHPDQEFGLQSPELHLTDQSGGGSTAVLEGEACLSRVSSEAQDIERSSSMSVTSGLPLQREGSALASQTDISAPLLTTPWEVEAVRSDVSWTTASMSQSTTSELPFHSHSQQLHSQELHSQELHSQQLQSQELQSQELQSQELQSQGLGSSSLVELATQRLPHSSNSESSNFDSSTLQADSASEKFSSPFSGSLSSFRMPSSLPSQSSSSLKFEEEAGSAFSGSQHDFDASIPELLPSHPPLQSTSTLLASASAGSYTFASLPTAIKIPESSIDEFIERDSKTDEHTQTGVSVGSLGFETRYDTQEPDNLELGVEYMTPTDRQLSPLLESSDRVEETVTTPEVQVECTELASREDTELDVPFLDVLTDDREGDTPTKVGRYSLGQQCEYSCWQTWLCGCW